MAGWKPLRRVTRYSWGVRGRAVGAPHIGVRTPGPCAEECGCCNSHHRLHGPQETPRQRRCPTGDDCRAKEALGSAQGCGVVIAIIYVGPDYLVQPGDLLRRRKDSGLGWHLGTGVSDGLVKDTMPGIGKRVVSFEVFCDGKQGYIYRPDRTGYEKAIVEQRALSDLVLTFGITVTYLCQAAGASCLAAILAIRA